jgi:hypothetical protein
LEEEELRVVGTLAEAPQALRTLQALLKNFKSLAKISQQHVISRVERGTSPTVLAMGRTKVRKKKLLLAQITLLKLLAQLPIVHQKPATTADQPVMLRRKRELQQMTRGLRLIEPAPMLIVVAGSAIWDVQDNCKYLLSNFPTAPLRLPAADNSIAYF